MTKKEKLIEICNAIPSNEELVAFIAIMISLHAMLGLDTTPETQIALDNMKKWKKC